MLMGFNGILAAGSAGVASVTYAGMTNSGDLTNPTVTVPIGTAAANRYVVIVVVQDNSSSTSSSMSSCTIAGISCTKIVATAAQTNTAASIFVTNTPIASGTTASLVFSGTADSGMAFITYAAYGINPISFATLTVSSNDPSGSINVPANGILIAGSVCDSATTSCTWTGVTESVDDSFEAFPSVNATASAGIFTTDTTLSRTVTATWSTSDNDKLVAASWGPG